MKKIILLIMTGLLLAACVKSPSTVLLMGKSYEQDMSQATGNALLAQEVEESKPLIDLSFDK